MKRLNIPTLLHPLVILLLIFIPKSQAYIPFSPSFFGINTKPESTNSTNGTETDEEHRIVGGRDARPGEAPYQLSLLKHGELLCGASLVVSPRTGLQFAVTAAHCVTYPGTSQPAGRPEEYLIRGGSVNRNQGQTLRVGYIWVHEKWNPNAFKFDIALLFFHGHFELSEHLYPIELADNPKRLKKLKDILVSGWGAEEEGNEYIPSNLKIVKVPLVTIPYCRNAYRKINPQSPVANMDNSQFCAGYPQGKKDSCQGDSGGPAVMKDRKGTLLVGVVSYGLGCARPGIPGVYTKVYAYLGWIRQNVAIYEYYTGYRRGGRVDQK